MPSISMRSEAGNERQGFIDPADFEVFLSELRQRDAAVAEMVEAAYFTLLRRSNVRNLTWPMFLLDVDAGNVVRGELRLTGTMTKNKRPLALPLTGRLLTLINRRWQARSETSPYVFHRHGRPLEKSRATWKAAATAIGRPLLIMHDLRRSGARALIRAGVPEDVVLKLGGWRGRSMLMRYNVVDTADLADAQEKLTAAFADAPAAKVVPLRRVS
jgi:integrase